MNKDERFISIQKEVFRYGERLEDGEFIQLMDEFVFEPNPNKTPSPIFSGFLEHTHCTDIWERHMMDVKTQPYFLKCYGSDLNYLDELKRSLFVYSYNRWRDEVRNKLG
jgi:hypothetical protein